MNAPKNKVTKKKTNSPSHKTYNTILALDIASKTTGYAIFKNNTYSKSGTIKVESVIHKFACERFTDMADSITGLIGNIHPDIVVYEAPYIDGLEIQSCEYLYKLCGTTELFCNHKHIPVYSYPANDWRTDLDLYDRYRTTSEYKALSIKTAFTITNKLISDDNEADAVCIGSAFIKK